MAEPIGITAKRTACIALIICLCFHLAAADEEPPKKKSKFLASMPMIIKFSLFWWCAFCMMVMLGFIVDRLLTRRYGPKRIYWSVERTFAAAKGREVCWAQFADPTRWSEHHPVLASADVTMVKGPATIEAPTEDRSMVLGFDISGGADEAASAAKAAASSRYEEIPLAPLQEGTGIRLWFKQGSGRLEGLLYCTRICTEVSTPADGPWRLCMTTVEAGPGHHCLAGSEILEVEVSLADEAGKVHLAMQGCGDVGSRFRLWWTGLAPQLQAAGEAMITSIIAESNTSR
mmetsp:Transcript_49891/g.112287  ORF Transcript_49891/g.112287 Transcript_49891/m.112287 type:complete len:288 (-) Transcript_49891:26-889(-)